MKKIVFITGATSGIGMATAKLLAKGPYKLILCGRRETRLHEIKSQLSDLTEVHTLCFDVRDRKAVCNAVENLPAEWKNVDVLINNAGNAHGFEPIYEGNEDDWDAMIDINVKGLLYVSKAIVPGMVSRKSGHVINIGSIAGKEVYANGNVYCGSKHAVDAISNGMRIDLLAHGVKVSLISPGLVNTEFSLVRFKGDSEKADSVYQGLHPLYAEDIADIIAFVMSRPEHVNLSDIVVFPKAQATSTLVYRNKN